MNSLKRNIIYENDLLGNNFYFEFNSSTSFFTFQNEEFSHTSTCTWVAQKSFFALRYESRNKPRKDYRPTHQTKFRMSEHQPLVLPCRATSRSEPEPPCRTPDPTKIHVCAIRCRKIKRNKMDTDFKKQVVI